jgi:hypothetical protein
MVGRNRFDVKRGLHETTEIQLSAFCEFSNTASKATVEAGNSVVMFVITDLGSAARAASTQPNHQGCPRGLHRSTVAPLVVNSSLIPYLKFWQFFDARKPNRLALLAFYRSNSFPFDAIVCPINMGGSIVSSTVEKLPLKFRGFPAKSDCETISLK